MIQDGKLRGLPRRGLEGKGGALACASNAELPWSPANHQTNAASHAITYDAARVMWPRALFLAHHKHRPWLTRDQGRPWFTQLAVLALRSGARVRVRSSRATPRLSPASGTQKKFHATPGAGTADPFPGVPGGGTPGGRARLGVEIEEAQGSWKRRAREERGHVDDQHARGRKFAAHTGAAPGDRGPTAPGGSQGKRRRESGATAVRATT
jgi:hypothetical protein